MTTRRIETRPRVAGERLAAEWMSVAAVIARDVQCGDSGARLSTPGRMTVGSTEVIRERRCRLCRRRSGNDRRLDGGHQRAEVQALPAPEREISLHAAARSFTV